MKERKSSEVRRGRHREIVLLEDEGVGTVREPLVAAYTNLEPHRKKTCTVTTPNGNRRLRFPSMSGNGGRSCRSPGILLLVQGYCRRGSRPRSPTRLCGGGVRRGTGPRC